MRLLHYGTGKELYLTQNLIEDFPPYTILSHTWGTDEDEVTFEDMTIGPRRNKPGYGKIYFCGQQSENDGVSHFWVDTCCINKANNSELNEAIASMFRWYQNAEKCYVFLADVSISNCRDSTEWQHAFRQSRWFTRGWTLQELISPKLVEFYSSEGEFLGSKATLIQLIHEITTIPVSVLNGAPLSSFPVAERMRWATGRRTKRREDRAYCLLGIMNVFMPLIYGEGDNAYTRLHQEISKSQSALQGLTPDKDASSKLHEAKQDLIRSLSYPEIDSRFHSVDNANDDTCDWFFRHHSYARWSQYYDYPEAPVLWIQGKPGSGKSTLMKAAFRRGKEVSQEVHKQFRYDIVIRYFFNARGASIEHNLMGFYRSILHQMLLQIEEVDTEFLEEFCRRKKHIIGWEWNESELRDKFLDTLHQMSRYKCRLYIDALDECGERSARSVIDFLDKLLDLAGSTDRDLRVCMSSRLYPNLHMRSSTKLFMEDNNFHDIHKVVSNRLQALGDASIQLATQIASNCSGIFLWAILVLEKYREDIENGELPATQLRNLSTLPGDLSAVFHNMITAIAPSELKMFRSLIAWVLCAERPLNLHELRLALAFQDPFPTSLVCSSSIAFVKDEESMTKLCQKWGRGLVEINRRKQDGLPVIQFIHESVRDFLLDPERLELLQLGKAEDFLGFAHDHIARSCFNYLRIGEYESAESSIDLSFNFGLYIAAHLGNYHGSEPHGWLCAGFLEYASKYAFLHASNAQDHGISPLHIIKKVHDPPDVTSLIDLPGSYERIRFRTHYFLNNLAEERAPYNEPDQYGLCSVRTIPGAPQLKSTASAINDAESEAQKSPLVSLTVKGTDIDKSDAFATVMVLVLQENCYGIARTKYRQGVSYNSWRATYIRKPSIRESRIGWKPASNEIQLFARGILGDSPRSGESNHRLNLALLSAASEGYIELTRWLIHEGADIRAESIYEYGACAGKVTHPLEAVASRGHLEIIEELLKEAQRNQLEYGYYQEALDAAFSMKHRSMMHRLTTAMKASHPDQWPTAKTSRLIDCSGERIDAHTRHECHAHTSWHENRPGVLELFVRTKAGRTIHLYIHPDLKCIDLKIRIEDKSYSPTWDQYLVFGGRLIREDEYLCNRIHTPYATVHELLPIWGNRRPH